MIIARRQWGKVGASQVRLESAALRTRQSAPVPAPGSTPGQRLDAVVERLVGALSPLRRAALTPRVTLRAARSLDYRMVAPLLLLALAASAFTPWTRFELHTASYQVALETSATLISALAAILFLDRFRRHLRMRDLLLAGGLAVIAASNLGTGLMLAGNLVLAGHSAAWLVLGGRLAGWVLIAGSAVVSERRLSRPTPATIRATLLSAAGIAAAAALFVALDAHTTSYAQLHDGPLGNRGAMLVAQILLALLAGIAFAALRRDAGREGNRSARLLGLAYAFAASSAFAACATPSFYASRVGVSDILRLGWLAMLFAYVCVEWSRDERHARVHALAHERNRVAADVHDLIMQDLSLALAHARTLVDDPAYAPRVGTVVTAGERALANARVLINGLAERDCQPIAEAVEESVRAAARHTSLTFHAAGAGTPAEPDELTRDTLVHIAREAVTNAVKHARPGAIEVTLGHDDEWRLTVRDDGRGFDSSGGGEGFGLASMRRHAEALGGVLRIHSDDGSTTVEASLP
jgi:signal transduction histidine kinase